MAPPSGDDAMEEEYAGDLAQEEEQRKAAEATEAAEAETLEAKQAEENAARAQLAAAPAAQAAAGGAGFVTEIIQGFTVRTYHDTDPQDYAEFHQAGKCYLVDWLNTQKNFGVAYDENMTVIGQLDMKTGLLSFSDDQEAVTVSMSAAQAAKPGEIQSAVKVQQAREKRDKAAVKTEVKSERDAELAGLDVQRAELEHEIANSDKNAAAALYEEALVRLFPQSLAV